MGSWVGSAGGALTGHMSSPSYLAALKRDAGQTSRSFSPLSVSPYEKTKRERARQRVERQRDRDRETESREAERQR